MRCTKRWRRAGRRCGSWRRCCVSDSVSLESTDSEPFLSFPSPPLLHSQELVTCKGALSELTQQLTMSHAAREDAAYRAARSMERGDLTSWISSSAITHGALGRGERDAAREERGKEDGSEGRGEVDLPLGLHSRSPSPSPSPSPSHARNMNMFDISEDLS